MHLLHIDSSPRQARSHTRQLTASFIEKWRACSPHDTVTYRDLGLNPLPHVSEEWIAAAFTPAESRTANMQAALRQSDELVDELLAADLIVAGIPFYNFGMPSGFKAYVDQIVRIGRTFAFDPQQRDSPYTSLVKGKRMIALISRGDGGYEPGGPNEAMNHLDPHLRTVFGFIGITDIEIVAAENDEWGGPALEASLQKALEKTRQIAAHRTPAF
ncbi:FMN-dependent NADH-azoreductase [Bremerella cremea]|uniref:FMN dependent NADH:quinone oxidoreductase n=1 Tax=Bremerella cremea TaxID=1031537 RepID=A0A368KN20_9BACT|nr:NAD(P)H-dependent oxidoreductase [Bremerella cremea]RCS44594.1 FMN-dependent NADH-azoreductase [Bremerella cremea]